MIKQTLKSSMAMKISRSRKEVFKRNDFEKLADYDQVGRALLIKTRFSRKITYRNQKLKVRKVV